MWLLVRDVHVVKYVCLVRRGWRIFVTMSLFNCDWGLVSDEGTHAIGTLFHYEKIHENMHVVMLSCIKHACFHVFSPFRANFSPHDPIVGKGSITY